MTRQITVVGGVVQIREVAKQGPVGPQGPAGDAEDAGDMAVATYDPQAIEGDAFDRANHTGTQLLATISDAGTALGGKADVGHGHAGVYEPADATILKDADIGVSVQAHDPVLDATTASFTTDDETKLDGIAAGATANSADATLLARANHTGTQILATISDAGTAAAADIGDFATAAQGTLADSAMQPGDPYIDVVEVAEPDAPGADTLRVFGVDDSGFIVLETKDSDGRVFRICEDTYRVVRNTSGAPLTRGQVVYYSGSTGQKPNVGLARANATATMPAVAMVAVPFNDNAFGIVIVVGRVESLNTSAFTEGDELYVSSTVAGALTNVRPTHPNFAQAVGTVEVSHANNGTVLVACAPFKGGHESGTVRNEFAIGDGLAGAKDLAFVNAFRSLLRWDATAARTMTLPDATGTVALTSDLQSGALTPYSRGTISTGTVTPEPGDGEMQTATNGGAHAWAAPTTTGGYVLTYTNGASAGAITTSGFDVVTDPDGALAHVVDGSIIRGVVYNDGVSKELIVALIEDATP